MTPPVKRFAAVLMALLIGIPPMENALARTCHCDREKAVPVQADPAPESGADFVVAHNVPGDEDHCKCCDDSACCKDSANCCNASAGDVFIGFFDKITLIRSGPHSHIRFPGILHPQCEVFPLLRPPIA